MGCLQTKKRSSDGEQNADPPVKTVDPRLPFENYRQLFRLKNSWKSVSRVLETAAVDCLVIFFQQYPEHQRLHKDLALLETEEAMRSNTSFQNTAFDIFNTIDEVMMSIEKVDQAISILNRVGKVHQRVVGFDPSSLKDMEEAFLKSVEMVLEDRFTDSTRENFKLLYQFICEHMLEVFQDDNSAENRL